MPRGGTRAGAGRPPGRKNVLTIALKKTLGETLLPYEPAAIAAIVAIAGDSKATPSARASCAKMIIEGIHGRPKQQVEHGGTDGGPIKVVIVGSDAALL